MVTQQILGLFFKVRVLAGLPKLNMNNIQVIILAAGQSKRMKTALAKPLVQLLGKGLLEWVLDAVAGAGFTLDPIVVVGHQILMWVLFATYDPDHVHPTMIPLSGLGAVTLAVHAFFYNLAPAGGEGGGGAEEGGAQDLKKDL